MGLAPIVVGRKRDDADDAADRIVDPARLEKRAVPAIMLQGEEPYEEAAAGNGQQKRQPIAVIERIPHAEP